MEKNGLSAIIVACICICIVIGITVTKNIHTLWFLFLLFIINLNDYKKDKTQKKDSVIEKNLDELVSSYNLDEDEYNNTCVCKGTGKIKYSDGRVINCPICSE
jgi:hypothetical protein